VIAKGPQPFPGPRTRVALLKNGSDGDPAGRPLTQGTALIRQGRILLRRAQRCLHHSAFTRIERGAGMPGVERVAYVVDQALAQLKAFEQFILIGAGVR